jgi:hypothetical protein
LKFKLFLKKFYFKKIKFQAGFVCGEPIFFTAEIENKSRREIKDIKVKLVQKAKLRAAQKVKTCFRLVSTLQHPQNVSAKTTKNWDGRLCNICFVNIRF